MPHQTTNAVEKTNDATNTTLAPITAIITRHSTDQAGPSETSNPSRRTAPTPPSSST
jgi:hypothetical protein